MLAANATIQPNGGTDWQEARASNQTVSFFWNLRLLQGQSLKYLIKQNQRKALSLQPCHNLFADSTLNPRTHATSPIILN